MKKPHLRKRVICAAAAVLLTGLSATVFVSAEPTNLDRYTAAAQPAAFVSVDASLPSDIAFPINMRLFMQGLSVEEWLQVARTPVSPPMPWFALRDLSDEELIAIYHYARSVGAYGDFVPAVLPISLANRPSAPAPAG